MTIATAIAVNRTARLVLLTDDVVVPITAMLDEHGDETSDPDKCLIAIVQLPCGRWGCCDLRDFENVWSH